MSNNTNYLTQLNAARAANGKQSAPDVTKAMSDVRKYSEKLSALSADDLKDLDELMGKVDSLSGIFEKYAKIQGKIETLKENAAFIESSLSELKDATEEANIEPFAGCTQEQTYAINVQLVKEFETGSRLSKDLLKLSESQVLDAEVPDEVPAYNGLTKEQTVQVYMQVMDEFEGQTQLAKWLAYNAGVE